MAEPFAAAVAEQEDLVGKPLQDANYKPAWEQTPTIDRGQKQIDDANKAANAPGVLEQLKQAPDTFIRSAESGTNTGYQLIRQMDRAYSSGDVDPAWRDGNADKWLHENRQAIPETDDWRFREARNLDEAEQILADKQKWANDAKILSERTGIIPTVAWALPGLLDIDAPITFGTGGLTAAAKTGIMASKAAQFMGGAAVGALSGAVVGGGSYLADPNADWTVIPLTGLMGMGFGAAGGAFAHTAPRANEAKLGALNEFGETLADGMPRATRENMHTERFESPDNYHSVAAEEADRLAQKMAEAAAKDIKKASPSPAVREPEAIKLEEIEPDSTPDVFTDPDLGKGSIGARQLSGTGPGMSSITSTKVTDIIQTAKTRVQQLGLSTNWLDGWRNVPGYAQGVSKQVERFHNIVTNSPLASDFAKMMNSGSAVAQSFAYDMLENATGIIRNGRSGARTMEHYEKGLLSRFTPFDENFNNWSKDQGAGMWQRMTDVQLRNRFNNAVTEELNARFYDGAGVPNQNPRIKAAADAVDETFKHEVEVTKGRPGELGIKGTDQLKPQTGYMPQKWLGRNMKKLQQAGITKKMISDAIQEGYKKQYPHLKAAQAKTYADAVVDFAYRSDGGINTNLVGMLTGDGREALEDIFRRKGMSEHEIGREIDRMKGVLEERGVPGWAKGRMDIDLRFVASNGVKIMDLVDNDFQSMIPQRARRSAGQAALARKGIRSREDWNDIKRSIRQEQEANGQSQISTGSLKDKIADYIDSDKHVSDEFLDGIYSYFSGQPVAGGISPSYARIKKLTNLALLNQLGLTQLAELGPTMAAVGIEAFMRHAGEALTGALRNSQSELVNELKHMNILVPEEKLFRADLTHEFEKRTTQNEWARGLDRFLNKAVHVQGYTSGFNTMRNFQQRIAVTSAAEKIAKHFRDGNVISPERLRDMGLDGPDIAKLKTYVDNGTVEWDAAGNLKKLNMSKWDPDDADLFSMTLNQRTNTLVQKAMAGESSMLFHKDGLAQLFFHLKSFPLLALEKQAFRQTRMMDTEAAMTFMYGLATAAAAYTVRQTVNGRTDRLDFQDIAKGAFGYSNMTGWIPMWTDPLAAMLGMDSLMFGGYGGRADVISPLVSIETLNRVVKAPAALGRSMATMSVSNSDINALSAFPLIGNAYGFGLMWTLMRNDNTEKKEAQRKEQRDREKLVADREARRYPDKPEGVKPVDNAERFAPALSEALGL